MYSANIYLHGDSCDHGRIPHVRGTEIQRTLCQQGADYHLPGQKAGKAKAGGTKEQVKDPPGCGGRCGTEMPLNSAHSRCAGGGRPHLPKYPR